MKKLPLPVLPPWLRWAGVVVIAGFLFYTSILAKPPGTVDPVKPGPPDLIPLDKWRHFVAYLTLAGGLSYATVDWERPTWQLAAFVIGITVVYGVGIEFGQSLIPNRYFGLGDAYANAIGGLLALPWFTIRHWINPRPVFSMLTITRE